MMKTPAKRKHPLLDQLWLALDDRLCGALTPVTTNHNEDMYLQLGNLELVEAQMKAVQALIEAYRVTAADQS